jgi:hypothetical protein
MFPGSVYAQHLCISNSQWVGHMFLYYRPILRPLHFFLLHYSETSNNNVPELPYLLVYSPYLLLYNFYFAISTHKFHSDYYNIS